jgi:ATP-binding cassette, subfamily C, bacteriocin exporter
MAYMKEWIWRRVLIRQRDLSDCGPACLAAVCKYYNKYVAVSQIRQLAKTNRKGTTVLGIVEAALKLGFDAKGVRADSTDVISLPAIVHAIIDERFSHYLVLIRIAGKTATFMDPAEGKLRTMRLGEFRKIWTGIAVLLVPGENFSRNEKTSTFKKISALIVPFRTSLAQASVCAAVVSLLGICISVYVREIVDVILVRKNVGLLKVASMLAIVVLLIQGIVTMIKGQIVLRTGTAINRTLIMTYYRHVLRLPQSFFNSMRVGEMLSRINDAAKITGFIHEVAVNLVVDALIVVFSVCAMFYFNWKMALLVLSAVPVYCLIYFISNRVNRYWQRKIAMSGADLDASLVESIGAATTIRSLALEKYFGNNVSAKLDSLLNNVFTASSMQVNIQVATDLISKIVTVILLWTGSYYVIRDTMTTGELMLFYTLLMWLTVPLLYLIAANKMFNEAAIAAERLFEIMELEIDDKGYKQVNTDDLKIEFRDVWFAYDYNDYIFKGIQLSITKGMILGITGKSGSGKSTLSSLLLRAYSPTSGTIMINGVDICEIDRTCLSEIISVVSQKTDLFSTTIRENITIGSAYDEEWLNCICTKLGVTAFSSFFTDGLDTMVCEQGNNLSGGQKQRIAIARAIYRNTPVLILDEATTAIDCLSEEKIMQTIEWYKNSGNTVIIIAHSESTLKICDNIVILDDGVIK